MPYIIEESRKDIDRVIKNLPRHLHAAELNYIFCKIVLKHLKDAPKVDYACINGVIGALECAKLEIYRRLAVPYEEKKREENGDVF